MLFIAFIVTVLKEIEDREEFISRMRELRASNGQQEKIIRREIMDKLREMEILINEWIIRMLCKLNLILVHQYKATTSFKAVFIEHFSCVSEKSFFSCRQKYLRNFLAEFLGSNERWSLLEYYWNEHLQSGERIKRTATFCGNRRLAPRLALIITVKVKLRFQRV